MKVPRYCHECGQVLQRGAIMHGFNVVTRQPNPSTETLQCPDWKSSMGYQRHDRWLFFKGLFGGRWHHETEEI